MATDVVEIMKRVYMTVRVVPTEGLEPGPPAPLDFIFGIASQGLSPFECEISGKPVGHEGLFSIDPSRLHLFFDHLTPVLLNALPRLLQGGATSVAFRIASIAEPDRREIIKAMAAATEGCTGGCGCGCGSH